MNKNYTLLLGNCIETLKQLPDNYIQTCVTSPPYFNLRDYGTGHWEGGDPTCEHQGKLKSNNRNFIYSDGRGDNAELRSTVCEKCGAIKVDEQIGIEDSPNEYIQNLVTVFREVRRVLKDDGTLWVNIGDSYCNSNGFARVSDDWQRNGRKNAPANDRNLDTLHSAGYKTKDLIGIPWMLAFALREDGWYLRQDIIWQKTNPMPESVTDRCVKSHEYIFLFSKSPQYYFDYKAIEEDALSTNGFGAKFGGTKYGDSDNSHYTTYSGNSYVPNGKRRKRDVWEVAVNNYKEAHFATYPTKLIEPCILAGSAEGDIVLDPFNGSGTTGVAALQNQRHYIGCELNSDYIDLTKKRFDEIFEPDKVEIQVDNNCKQVLKQVELF